MVILRENELENAWPVDFFRKAYSDIRGDVICKCMALVSGESEHPDETALVFVRMFVENGSRAKKQQKYIVGLRFYGFGDMATIDILSLDLDYHRDITKEHARRMGWSVQEYFRDALKASYIIPMAVSGAYLETGFDPVQFKDKSTDFGANLFGCNANEIAKQSAFLLEVSGNESKEGLKFFEDLICFLRDNKLEPDFYERVVERYSRGNFTGQNFGGLLTMKAFDLATEGRDFLHVVVEELTGGFAAKSIAIAADKRMDS